MPLTALSARGTILADREAVRSVVREA